VLFDGVRTDQQAELLIAPHPRALSGTIHEAPPTEQTVISGAHIEVVSGANRGTAATTDGSGHYTLPNLWGEFDVELKRDGFSSRTVHVAMTDDASPVDVPMLPAPRTLTEGGNVVGCVYCRAPFNVTVPVHNAGEIAIVDVGFTGFEEGDSFRFQVWQDSQLLAETVVERAFPRNTVALRVGVSGGAVYQIRGIAEGASGLYAISFSHPN